MSSESKSVLPKILAGCVLVISAIAAAIFAGVLAVLIGGNMLMGSAPTHVDASYTGSVYSDGISGQLTGEGAVVFRDFVANRSHPSLNPVRILWYNFDYHVVGMYGYPLSASVSPTDGYGDYSLTQDGTGFVWRENGAAFAQVRSADFSDEELAIALKPHLVGE